MAFGVYSVNAVESTNKVQVDWEALNKYVVETANIQGEEVITGVISGLIDVGVQKQEDAKMESDVAEEDEADFITENPNTYFETLYDYEKKEDVRYKRWPVKDQQAVVLMVDFPEIMLDKSPFFGGESDPKPLRLVLGGEFIPYKGADKVAAKPIPLTIRKNDKTNNQWSMPFNSTPYKMASAAKIVEKGAPFLPQDIDKLLGQALQFKVVVGFNDKGYYTEKCAFAAGLGRNQTAPAYDQSIIHIVQFKHENTEDDLKQLRASVRNTMKKATNYVGSKVQVELDKLLSHNAVDNTSQDKQEAVQEKVAPQPPKSKAKPAKAPVDVPEDDTDSPF
jgi:hypothetical protein